MTSFLILTEAIITSCLDTCLRRYDVPPDFRLFLPFLSEPCKRLALAAILPRRWQHRGRKTAKPSLVRRGDREIRESIQITTESEANPSLVRRGDREIPGSIQITTESGANSSLVRRGDPIAESSGSV